MSRRYSLLDRALMGADRGLKTLVQGSAKARRPQPGDLPTDISSGSEAERRHASGLMRINHTGEVCAQALYQGQALTARDACVKAAMAHSAEEEVDHLAWCEQRLKELNSRPSALNPLFYAASFAIGAAAGAVGDKVSLGFVAATENQVCQHLRDHLLSLPESDQRSKAILQQMLIDEADHASKALAAGGQEFPESVKKAMTLMSKVMTGTTYYV